MEQDEWQIQDVVPHLNSGQMA